MVLARAAKSLAFCALVAGAADPPSKRKTATLADSSIEELMQIEVTSVSKKQQKLSRSAAAVYVITHEDIRRSGVTTLPEALRLAPGVQVARIDESIWAIGIRGFTDEYSNKLLVLVDGRSIYNELFSGVYWDTQDLMLDNIERIEIIRGPGAAVWGANSVNGVINIITRSASNTQGEYLTAGAGSFDRVSSGLRYGGRIGKQAHFRTHYQYSDREPFSSASGTTNYRNWRNSSSGFRLDWDRSKNDSYTFIGDLYRSTSAQTPVEQSAEPPYSRPIPEIVSASNSSIVGRWTRRLSDTAGTQLQVAYDDYARTDEQLPVDSDMLSIDFQNNFSVGSRHNLIWGAGYRCSRFDTEPRAVRFAEAQIHTDLFSTFVQDEIALIPDRLFLIAGIKAEHNSFTEFEAQPTVRAIWEPNTRSSTWVSFSRAVRTPSLLENSLRATVPLPPVNGLPAALRISGNKDFLPETVLAYEAGQRLQVHRKLGFDLAVFYNAYDRLQGIAESAPQLTNVDGIRRLVISGQYDNTHRGSSYGGELTGTWSLLKRWRLTGSYSRLQVLRNARPGFENARATNGFGRHPLNQYQVRSYIDLPRHIQLDASLFYGGRLQRGEIARNYRADLRVSWMPREYMELSLVGQRLFGPPASEFKSDRFVEPYRVERAVFGRVTWRF